MKKFYSHLIEIESILVELDSLELEKDHRHELARLVDTHLHQTVLDAILSELTDEDKKIFMNHLQKDDHSKIWEHLNKKTDNIEEKIRSAAEELKKDLHKDIKAARRV